jgi:hypothetical protein
VTRYSRIPPGCINDRLASGQATGNSTGEIKTDENGKFIIPFAIQIYFRKFDRFDYQELQMLQISMAKQIAPEQLFM